MFSRTIAVVCVSAFCLFARGSAQCPEKNGRFPVARQCDAYLECQDGVAEEKLCPDGLLFNEKAKFFTYPCSYPIDVNCAGRSSLQPAQATDDCPHQFGYYRLGDQSNCGRFMNCASGRGYEMNCPIGLAYNEDNYQCDWPDQVPTCDPEAFLGFRCPEVTQPGVFQGQYQFYRNPSDCQQYFLCINGKPRLFVCGAGYAFNEDIAGCDGIENVTACASSRSIQDTQRPVQLTRRQG